MRHLRERLGVGRGRRRRRRRPEAEILEPRCLLATTPVEFPLRSLGGAPVDIASTPDGNLWFTLDPSNIGMLDPRATPPMIRQYPLPTYNAKPGAITVGADGNPWFLETAANSIATIDRTTGTGTEYPVLSSVDSGLRDITKGPDGNLWFTETSLDRIGRFNPSDRSFFEFQLQGYRTIHAEIPCKTCSR